MTATPDTLSEKLAAWEVGFVQRYGRKFTLALVVVLLAALLSGLIVRRRLDHLDLIAVLKTRE